MNRPFRLRRAAPAFAVAALAAAAVAPAAPDWIAPAAVAAPTAEQSFERGSPTWTALRADLSRVRSSRAPHGRAVARIVRKRGGAFGIAGGPAHAVRGGTDVRYRATAWVRAVGPASARRPARMIVVERTPAGRVVKTTRSKLVRLTGRFQRVGVIWSPRAAGNRVVARIVQGRAVRRAAFEVDALTLVNGRALARPRPAQAPAGPAPAATPPAAPAAAEVRPYDPGALFNQPVTGLPLDPRSGAIVSGLAANVRSVKVNASVSGEVPTVYVASPSDPFYSIPVSDGGTTRFRIPAGAQAGSGSDHPMVILDPNHPDHGRNVELRLWQARIDHGARRVSGSGVGLFHYNNDGARLNPDGSPSVSTPFRGWGTGSGLSYMAGLLRPQDISAGRVTHAIRVAWGGNDFVDGFRAPAVKTDQGGSASHGVQMGMRLRLDPSVDCSRRTAPVPPGAGDSARETQFLRIVCRGLQEYGLIVLDGTASDGLIVYMENEGTAAWEPVAGRKVYGGYGWILRDATTPGDGMSRNAESGIPWSRMQVVR